MSSLSQTVSKYHLSNALLVGHAISPPHVAFSPPTLPLHNSTFTSVCRNSTHPRHLHTHSPLPFPVLPPHPRRPVPSAPSHRPVVVTPRNVLNTPSSQSPSPSTSPSLAPLSVTSTNAPLVKNAPPFGFDDPTFATAVSGEWFGHEVSFSVATGDALSIEERLIPDAFRDWGVAVTGFDTVTSSTVTQGNILTLNRTRALPTVGCEADAIVPETRAAQHVARTIVHSSPSSPSSTPPVCNGGFPDGSASLGPMTLPTEGTPSSSTRPMPFAAILAEPGSGGGGGGKGGRRARVEFGRVDLGAGGRVTVFVERWDAPFSNGAILPGCGGPDASFASGERVRPEDLAGVWRVEGVSYARGDGWRGRRVEGGLVERGAVKFFAMPCGLSVRVAEERGGIVVEAGWLGAGGGVRTVVRRLYEGGSGELGMVEYVVEKRVEG